MTQDEEAVYYWILCKVCGKLHRGPMVRPYPNRMNFQTIPPDGKMECPDNPGKFAEYNHADWKTSTESNVDKLLGK